MEDKNGKQVPKKVGVGSQQEKDIEYNYTATFNIDQETHVATVAKDNTHIFEGRYDVLNEKDGERLIKAPTPVEIPKSDIDSALREINSIFANKIEAGVDKELLYAIVSKHHTSKNFTSIKDVDVANTIINELKEVK